MPEEPQALEAYLERPRHLRERLKDKVAVVFGAGPNIGGTVAYFMAKEGARVVVCDRNEDAAIATASFIEGRGYKAHPVVGDAASEADVASAFEVIKQRHGSPSIVVNMAGRNHWGSVVDVEAEAFQAAMLSYPMAALFTTKHGARAMLDGNAGGSIIHILSTAAHFGQPAGAAYGAA